MDDDSVVCGLPRGSCKPLVEVERLVDAHPRSGADEASQFALFQVQGDESVGVGGSLSASR